MQTPYLDERLDPEKATRSAARYLRDLYNQLVTGTWQSRRTTAVPRNVQKAVQRTGYDDFWMLRNRGVLPLETANYVPIILAMTIMAKNPLAFDSMASFRNLPSIAT
jgi:membrane-bound lytic murein transglycosylase D